MPAHFEHDVLIIGSGAAGLALALQLPAACRVAVLSKGELTHGSTFQAQGGMAAVLDDEDTVESHVADTIAAGGGLCNPKVVEFVVSNSRGVVEWLVGLGVRENPDSPDRRRPCHKHTLCCYLSIRYRAGKSRGALAPRPCPRCIPI